MLRSIFYLSGAVALAYVAYKYAAWRVFFQVALVWVLLLWVIIGGWLVSRPRDARGHGTKPSASDLENLRVLAFRQWYSDKHGEDTAVRMEKDNPQVWRDYIRLGGKMP